jgi:single-strand DNA-binding protein
MMHSITITGNVGKDAELRTVRDKPVLNFNVGVKNGYGRDAGTVWYRCALWGNAATAFESSIKKGVKVFIQGDLKHDEYEGKPQFNIDVKGIDTGGGKSDGEQSSRAQEPHPGAHGGHIDNDLDDDVPF